MLTVLVRRVDPDGGERCRITNELVVKHGFFGTCGQDLISQDLISQQEC